MRLSIGESPFGIENASLSARSLIPTLSNLGYNM